MGFAYWNNLDYKYPVGNTKTIAVLLNTLILILKLTKSKMHIIAL